MDWSLETVTRRTLGLLGKPLITGTNRPNEAEIHVAPKNLEHRIIPYMRKFYCFSQWGFPYLCRDPGKSQLTLVAYIYNNIISLYIYNRF